MKRFIDLRGQGTGDRFAFFDTVTDRFEVHDDEMSWATWDEFTQAYGGNELQRYRTLCPAWAFEPEPEPFEAEEVPVRAVLRRFESIPTERGVYWYFAKGAQEPEPVLVAPERYPGCLKAFNGREQSWLRDGEYLLGPQSWASDDPARERAQKLAALPTSNAAGRDGDGLESLHDLIHEGNAPHWPSLPRVDLASRWYVRLCDAIETEYAAYKARLAADATHRSAEFQRVLEAFGKAKNLEGYWEAKGEPSTDGDEAARLERRLLAAYRAAATNEAEHGAGVSEPVRDSTDESPAP